MIRFDMHVNLRAFPASSRGQQQRDITPEEMADYFKTHNVTHALVLYNRDDYAELERLAKLTPTKCYGVQCVFGPTEQTPTCINTVPELDVNIEGRSFLTGGHCYGIKLASERGWWDRDGVVDSGLDYFKDKVVKKVLSSLPKNAIASFHTQGTSKPDNTASPMMIAVFAKNYPNVKFIMNHGGDYGPSSTAAKPSSKRILDGSGAGNLLRHISHRMIIKSALECAEFYHNVFIDFSCFTVAKGTAVAEGGYRQWCVGSDFPFSENFPIHYTNERTNFEKYSDIPDQEAVDFFEIDNDILLTKTLEFYDNYYQSFKSLRDERKQRLQEISN